MGIKFFEFLKPKNGRTTSKEVAVRAFLEAAQEFEIRNLCWMVCENLIANAIGRCEIKTYQGGREIKGDEYYLWNVEPNTNQNSTQFLHKMVHQLLCNGEALAIDSKSRKGREMLLVADSFDPPTIYPARQNEYTGVVVGEVQYDKTFREPEVLHLKMANPNLREVVNRMYDSYYRMYDAAVKAYIWGQGQHWKVHVDQIASGDDTWGQSFQQMIQDQVRPFLESNGAVLPEFDGYKYEDVGGNKDTTKSATRDIRELVEDIFDFTARAFLIPAVLVNGKVEATGDANKRFLTMCIDPIADQLQEEIVRKRYGLDEWRAGNFAVVDTSTLLHFDLFENATNIEKLVGSGVYTINDIKRAANQATINEAWADQHFMTLNIVPMQQAAAPVERTERGEKDE